MIEKRYTIVKCQRKCLYYEVISKKCLLDLEDCSKECINIKGKFQYGDTEEQLIKKVAQVLTRKYLRDLKCLTYKNSDVIAKDIKSFYKQAKEIIEFTRVK